ncbi:hypothetical protein GGR70_004072 [Xanthomonas campestris]|nr:hypothetical protein [Xanthomonas campestris]
MGTVPQSSRDVKAYVKISFRLDATAEKNAVFGTLQKTMGGTFTFGINRTVK